MSENSTRDDLRWYLAELVEACETLSRRHGYKLPDCHPYAKKAVQRADDAMGRERRLQHRAISS